MKAVKYQYDFIKALQKADLSNAKAPFVFLEEGFMWSTYDGNMLAAVPKPYWWLDSDRINQGASLAARNIAKFVDVKQDYLLGKYEKDMVHQWQDDKGNFKHCKVAYLRSDDGRHCFVNPHYLAYYQEPALYIPKDPRSPVMLLEEYYNDIKPVGFIWTVRCEELESDAQK